MDHFKNRNKFETSGRRILTTFTKRTVVYLRYEEGNYML